MSDTPLSNSKKSSSSVTRRAIESMKRKRCPKGTRRNASGDCVNTSAFQLEQSMRAHKKCPKGTRRNTAGNCVSYVNFLMEKSMFARNKCPKGTRRNVNNKCVSIESSQRAMPIKLLGSTKLFQISFNKSQLKDFTPVTNVQQSSSASFLNAVVALGLRDKIKATKDAIRIEKGANGEEL